MKSQVYLNAQTWFVKYYVSVPHFQLNLLCMRSDNLKVVNSRLLRWLDTITELVNIHDLW